MKQFFITALLTLSVTGAVFSQTPISDAKHFYDSTLVAFNSGDYDTYLNSLSDDVQAYAGVYSPFLFIDKYEWRNFIYGLKGYQSVVYDQKEPKYRNYGENVVLCNAYFIFTTVAHDGKVDVQSGRESMTMVKIDGNWKLVNFHFSALF